MCDLRDMSHRSQPRDLRDNFFTLNIPESKHTIMMKLCILSLPNTVRQFRWVATKEIPNFSHNKTFYAFFVTYGTSFSGKFFFQKPFPVAPLKFQGLITWKLALLFDVNQVVCMLLASSMAHVSQFSRLNLKWLWPHFAQANVIPVCKIGLNIKI